MTNNNDIDLNALADLFPSQPRKRRRTPRACFELLVEYKDGCTMEGEGTRRELLADFDSHVGGRDVSAVYLTRNGVEIREWRAEEEAQR